MKRSDWQALRLVQELHRLLMQKDTAPKIQQIGDNFAAIIRAATLQDEKKDDDEQGH